MIADRPELLEEAQRMSKVCEALCERVMKAKETNELLGLKFHIISHVFKYLQQSDKDFEPAVRK